jgi:CDP-glucose 4,6-dehydratase
LRYPKAIRPWQHVLELCDAYLELGARLLQSGVSFAEAWNFGPGNTDDVTVNDLVAIMLDAWGRPDHPITIEPSSLAEAHSLRLDIAKARSRLAWRPRFGVREALAWTTRWYKSYYADPGCAQAITAEQIRSYMERMRREDAAQSGSNSSL